jgi:hypothetical protein
VCTDEPTNVQVLTKTVERVKKKLGSTTLFNVYLLSSKSTLVSVYQMQLCVKTQKLKVVQMPINAKSKNHQKNALENVRRLMVNVTVLQVTEEERPTKPTYLQYNETSRFIMLSPHLSER